MKSRVFWLMVALGIVLGVGVEASAEIYLWTDEQGVVHMTNQWANVPESMRSRASVRESSGAPSNAMPTTEQPVHPMTPAEPLTGREHPWRLAPDLSETPPPAASSPSVAPYTRDTSVLIPQYRPFVHHPKKPSPLFPYNVRLDPFDPNFVWVGPNRVPKDTFTYPRVPLDTQAQFRDRIRALEQPRSVPHKTFPAQPLHP
jgi:hypothetical protein